MRRRYGVTTVSEAFCIITAPSPEAVTKYTDREGWGPVKIELATPDDYAWAKEYTSVLAVDADGNRALTKAERLALEEEMQ